MNTFQEMKDWIMAELNDTSTLMSVEVSRALNTILSPFEPYLGVVYDWNMNVSSFILSSGASAFSLPSTCKHVGVIFNSTYKCDVNKLTKRQREMYNTDTGGVVNAYYKVGSTIYVPPVFGSQTVYVEWYPEFASLVTGTDTPLCPDKMTLVEGAKWLLFRKKGKADDATNSLAIFQAGKQALKGEAEIELVNFEDPNTYNQEG